MLTPAPSALESLELEMARVDAALRAIVPKAGRARKKAKTAKKKPGRKKARVEKRVSGR